MPSVGVNKLNSNTLGTSRPTSAKLALPMLTTAGDIHSGRRDAPIGSSNAAHSRRRGGPERAFRVQMARARHEGGIVLLGAVGVLQGADLGNPVQQTQITFTAGLVAWIGALALMTKRAK